MNRVLCSIIIITMASMPNLSTTEYVSIEELKQSCDIPGPCAKKMVCEGKVALVKGYIDYSNVFDKKTYPHLPYEKFKIFDKRGNSLEVWAVSEDNRRIFKKIYKSRVYPGGMVLVRGVIVGFDTPIMGACHRDIKIEVKRESDVIVKTK